MAKRRNNNEEAVSLFPFMSILACLIGILTLMISVSMQVKQAESDDNSGVERALAVENRDLKKKAAQISDEIRKAEERLKKENSASAQLAELKDRKIVLKERLDKLAKAEDPKKADAALQKTLELMRAEIAALKNDRPPLVKKLEELKAELAKRKNPPKKVESVVVRTSGSGVRMAARLFFVECNSTGIVLIGEKDGTTAVATGAIPKSVDYASLLEEVKRTRDSMVLFLIRKEGSSAYQWAAGIAENNFEVRTGKIPIPNNGKIDLSMFSQKSEVARKRSSSDGGISLDSLMDALTNVVAVLILVLILVQADVTQKVQKFIDDLPPATPEDIAQSKKLIEELQRKQTVALARLREKPATPEDLAEEKRQIALLEKSMTENNELLADLEQVRALEKTVRAERDAEKSKTAAIQKEIADIEGLLDTIKPVDPNTPTVVNIPNSRPIPEEATTYYAIVTRGRLHFIDPNRILATFRREVERKKEDLIHQRIRKKGKPDTLVYDPEKIAAYFKNYNWGDTRGQTVEIVVNPTAFYMTLVIRPNLEKGGSPHEELSKPGGEFAKAIPVIRQSIRSVLLYRVHPDSFETYIAARELSEKVNIAAGWEVNGSPDFRMGIPGLTVKRLKEPPPSTGGGAPRPPGLKPKLD